MTAVLHLVPRPHGAEPSALARDLASAPWSDPSTIVRVLELFDARGGVSAVDLSLAERDVPEIAALLHAVTELHLHGIHPQIALRCLPDVKPAVLAGIRVVVHGPVSPPRARPGEVIVEWPTAVMSDLAAGPGLGRSGPWIPNQVFVDLDAPELLPRACGAIPLVVDGCCHLAVVCLSESLDDAVREHLRLEFAALTRPEVRVEVYDEGEVPMPDRAARRRAASAVVTTHDPSSPWPRTFVEAMAQGLPLVVLGAAPPAAPTGVVFTGHRDDVDRALACVRSWVASWAVGEAPAVDLGARRQWLIERRA